jgi:hypothetical protein
MKYLLFILFALYLQGITSCKTTQTSSIYPEFIQKEIKHIEKSVATNPPTKIIKYSYQNRIVYFITSHCCDIPSRLYDENGLLICQPDGGITGKGDLKCLDFFQNASNPVLVWEDARGKGATQ